MRDRYIPTLLRHSVHKRKVFLEKNSPSSSCPRSRVTLAHIHFLEKERNNVLLERLFAGKNNKAKGAFPTAT